MEIRQFIDRHNQSLSTAAASLALLSTGGLAVEGAAYTLSPAREQAEQLEQQPQDIPVSDTAARQASADTKNQAAAVEDRAEVLGAATASVLALSSLAFVGLRRQRINRGGTV